MHRVLAITFVLLLCFAGVAGAGVCPSSNVIEDPPAFQSTDQGTFWSGTLEIGPADFVIGTDTLTTRAYRINNASIVLTAEIFGHRFLFTGDANGKERDEASPGTPGHIEERLLELEAILPGALQAEVIKVPHHGSETASTQAFIDSVDPEFVIISASTKHHLPEETVVDRYSDGQRMILRTDDHPPNDTDHIICFQDQLGALDCNFEEILREA